jgi:hypothetical protein
MLRGVAQLVACPDRSVGKAGSSNKFLIFRLKIIRGVAQLVACLTGGQEAGSSSLPTPT